MFRFTIRELLILTVTAGLAVGWWLDHHYKNAREQQREEEKQLLEELEKLAKPNRYPIAYP